MTRTTALTTASEIDPALYREVLGHYPTGVTVVTALAGDEPWCWRPTADSRSTPS
jgi:flavin reductase (DIM6/NTAB) family NADH-FMN oxidoreductase RutF